MTFKIKNKMLAIVFFMLSLSIMIGVLVSFMYWATGIDTATDPTQPTYKSGRVFSFYGKWLMHRVWVAQASGDPNDLIRYYPLGLCRVCFSVWLSNFIYAAGLTAYYFAFEQTPLSLAQYAFVAFVTMLFVVFSARISAMLDF